MLLHSNHKSACLIWDKLQLNLINCGFSFGFLTIFLTSNYIIAHLKKFCNTRPPCYYQFMEFKKIIPFVLLCLLFLLAAGCRLVAQSQTTGDYTKLITVGNQKLYAAVAATKQAQTQGLSGREQMADDQGMLFPFNPPARAGFWMKDMKFNLDFIWIKDNKITFITPNVPAPIKDKGLWIKDDNLPVYYPPSAVDEVLEVNAGWTKKNNILIGDEIRF